MSENVYCFFLLFKGAPESILERCAFVRINGTEKVPMTGSIKDQIMEVVQKYGTGKDKPCGGG